MRPTDGTTVSPRNRRRRPPRATLERLVSRPPPRVQDCAVDADGEGVAAPRTDGAVADVTESRPDGVDVACWTPVGDGEGSEPAESPDLRTTLLANPSLPGGADDTVTHTLVLEVDAPTGSVAVDYRSLDVAVVPAHGVRVRTDDGEAVAVSEARVADDGTFRVAFAEPRTDGALFVEYDVTRNPSGGKHAVDVVVDGEREGEARLVVVG
jgi:hypothetical protein